jgi:hypothetical protein
MSDKNSDPIVIKRKSLGCWPSMRAKPNQFDNGFDIEEEIAIDPAIEGFDAKQPYTLAIYGEKSSLEDVCLSTSRGGVSTTFQSCQSLAMGATSAPMRLSSGECRLRRFPPGRDRRGPGRSVAMSERLPANLTHGSHLDGPVSTWTRHSPAATPSAHPPKSGPRRFDQSTAGARTPLTTRRFRDRSNLIGCLATLLSVARRTLSAAPPGAA